MQVVALWALDIARKFSGRDLTRYLHEAAPQCLLLYQDSTHRPKEFEC